jgi:N-carbamoylputrescine amidase
LPDAPGRLQGGGCVSLVAAAIQMATEPCEVRTNLERAEAALALAARRGAQLAALPELFNTGYCSRADYLPIAETRDGPTIRFLLDRARAFDMAIAGGFVEREDRHLYNSVAFCQPDGQVHVYRKRHLVFWESARFRPGRDPLIVTTPWGRVGFAICADMIHRRIWRDYHGRIDLAVVCSAWPDFADRRTGRPHWLYGLLGPMCAELPRRIASDLDIPVVFANQCGETLTKVPLMPRIVDRFAGLSSVCDGRRALPTRASTEQDVVLARIHPSLSPRGASPCPTTYPWESAAISSGPARG